MIQYALCNVCIYIESLPIVFMGKSFRRKVLAKTRDPSSPLNCASKSCGIDFNPIPNLKIHLFFPMIKIQSQTCSPVSRITGRKVTQKM